MAYPQASEAMEAESARGGASEIPAAATTDAISGAEVFVKRYWRRMIRAVLL
jgi:hypothetical protein